MNNTPTISVNSGSICSGDSFTLQPMGANTYTFSSGNVVSPLFTTSYSVTGKSSVGCLSSNTAVSNVFVNPPPSINVVTNHTTICIGETATLSATGGITYTFIPGGIGSSVIVTPSTTSTYTVTGNDANGCGKIILFTQKVNECTSISKFDLGRLTISIFPNPTDGIIYVVQDRETKIEIMNSSGQIVYSSELTAGRSQINLQHLAQGIYMVKANNSKVFKVVIEKIFF